MQLDPGKTPVANAAKNRRELNLGNCFAWRAVLNYIYSKGKKQPSPYKKDRVAGIYFKQPGWQSYELASPFKTFQKYENYFIFNSIGFRFEQL